MSEAYIVVADRFANFTTSSEHVVTETQLIERIVGEEFQTGNVRLLLEHGVDYSNVRRAIDRVDADDRYDIVLGGSDPVAPRRLAHKANPSNILIGYPRRVDDHRFELDVVFNPDSEFFADHMTGMHIQGMAIMEAARQSFLAVTEEFHLRASGRKYYFVIQSFNTTFVSFLFPLEAKLDYEIRSHASKADRHAFDVAIKIRQGGAVCAEFAITFTAFPEERIAEKEGEKAREAVTGRLADLVIESGIPYGLAAGGEPRLATS